MDDGWITSFASKAQSQPGQQTLSKRRQTINAGNHADMAPAEDLLNALEGVDANHGPPPATVARRARSYSDFYDVVRAHLKKEHKMEREKERRRNKELVKTDLEFGTWYNGIKGDLLEASHGEYQVYQDQLLLTESHLDSLLSSAHATLAILSDLSNSFKAVEAQTTAFQGQCEDLLNDQKRTTKLADDISQNLRFYTYLEPITRRLNAPGAGSFVRSKEYSEMLSNLDACLEYMQTHTKQRDSATYRSRYRLLLTRALTLIRVHFTNSLRDVAADVAKRIADRQLNDTTMSALLYAKFRVPAPELKQIGLEIQTRAIPPAGAEPGTEAEYQSLMNELYQSYSATRGKLLRPIIAKKMTEIAAAPSTSKDLVSFARSSIGFIRGICFDEYDLWGEWFTSDDEMYNFLESIIEPFYDHLRPRTIHETQLLKLCELCTLIQTRYMESEDDSEPESPQGPRLNFSALVHPALEDAQTRLVFLAMTTLRNDIEYYKPRPEDLDYPAKTSRAALSGSAPKSNQPVLSGRKNSNGPLSPMPNTPTIVDEDHPDVGLVFEPAMRDCYPTLRKAVWLLSRIYRLVHSAVFDDLAHQIVHQTTLSLHSASLQISQRASPTDAQLFLIRHLLTLKQQIVAFDIEFVTPDVSFDFSNVTATFWELRSRGGLFNPANLVRLVGGGLVPRVVRDMLDAKAELDGRLRTVINEFVESFSKRMLAPISSAAVAKAHKSFDALAATQQMRALVQKDVPFLRKKLDEYIGDTRTRETLVAAVMDQVVDAYEEWYGLWRKENGIKSAGKGKGRVEEVWDGESFGEWAASIFQVGDGGFAGGEDGQERESLGSDRGSL